MPQLRPKTMPRMPNTMAVGGLRVADLHHAVGAEPPYAGW